MFKATTKGVPPFFSNYRDSKVCFSRPCCKSMTKMAMSQRLEPLDLKLLKLSWPGVSIINKPGTSTSTSKIDLHFETYSISLAWGKNVAPICCVIPPASPSCTLVLRILSSKVVLPVSTWPRIQHTGLRYFPMTCWKSSLSSFNNFSYFFLNFSFFYYSLFISSSVFGFIG